MPAPNMMTLLACTHFFVSLKRGIQIQLLSFDLNLVTSDTLLVPLIFKTELQVNFSRTD